MEPNQGGDAKQVSENSADTEPPKALDDSTLPADLNQLTVEQLKAALNERGVSFDGKAVKAELVALLTTATAPKDGE